MQRIFAPVGNLGVERTDLSLAPAPLCLRKLWLKVAVACLFEVWRVMANSHSRKAQIDPDNLLSVRGGWTLYLDRKVAIPTAARILVEAAGFDLAVDIAVLPDVKLLAAQQDGGAVNGNILIGERHPPKTSLAAMADAPTKAWLAVGRGV
jgi:hypothetical protein